MEIPFYYNFKEFEENYENDLKKWYDAFPDAGETDYLIELRYEYQLFFYKNNSDFIINSNWIPDEYPEHHELSIIAYQEFMQEKLVQYLYNNGFSNFDGDYLDIPADINVMDFWNDCNVRTRKNSAIIDDEKHKYLKGFFTFDIFTEKLNIDVKKFTNFKFATKKILEFLDKKSQLVTSTVINNFDLNDNKNEIINLYQNANSENEKIQIVAEYIFKLSKEQTNEKDKLIDEEIYDLYFTTITTLRKEIITENSNTKIYPDYKVYELPAEDDYDFGKPHDREYYNENRVRILQYRKHQDDILQNLGRGIILNKLDFRQATESGGYYYNKILIGYKVFLKFKKLWEFQNQNITNKEILLENKKKLLKPSKIKVKGSLQSVGFLFSELIDKGYIQAPERNGNNNISAISRMILQHFEFIDREQQPNAEDIRKTLFTDNKLSADKQTLFKIPDCKIINTD